MSITKTTQIQFALPFTRDGSTCWNLIFTASPENPNEVILALHWQDKPFATYSQPVPREGLQKVLDTLAPPPATRRKARLPSPRAR